MTQTDTPTASWQWEEHEPAANGPVWVAYEEEPDEDDGDDGTTHLIAPANALPGDVYGWYIDNSNPSYVFDRELLPTILAMEIPDALVWLRARVTPRNLTWGMPFYVHTDSTTT